MTILQDPRLILVQQEFDQIRSELAWEDHLSEISVGLHLFGRCEVELLELIFITLKVLTLGKQLCWTVDLWTEEYISCFDKVFLK